MGCDIHIVLERHDDSQGAWVGVRSYTGFRRKLIERDDAGNAHTDGAYVWWRLKARDYSFFSDLCGVRGGGSSFGFTCRGLPEDASTLSHHLLSEDDGDLHSHSWLDMKELSGPLAANKVPESKIPALVAERMGNSGYNLKLLQDWVSDDIEDENIDQWRLVFAFDN